MELNNPFWTFSLSVYAKDGVAAECLSLQDHLHVNVNALLFCAWLGREKRVKLTSGDLDWINLSIGPWHENVVEPLRKARRAIRSMPTISNQSTRELRSGVAQNELSAEAIEQAMLYGLHSSFISDANETSSADAVAHNIHELLRHYTCNFAGSGEPPNANRLIAAAIAFTRI